MIVKDQIHACDGAHARSDRIGGLGLLSEVEALLGGVSTEIGNG